MKISIAGTGKIVEEVLKMLQHEFAGRIEITGIFSREKSVEHAIDLCQAYAPTGFVYTDYARMLQEAEADFVYIANANHVHYQYALQAIEAGHNVIIEKPIAVDRVETDALFDAAVQRCVYCLPAFSLLYMPMFRQLTELLPQLGTIRMVNGCYSQYSSRYDRYLNGEITPVFDPEQSGGCLRDLNIYNLCFTIGLFGPPRTIQYARNLGWNGVDTSGTLLMQYPTAVVSMGAAKDSDGLSFACIQGEKGYIEIKGSVSILQEFTLYLRGQEPQTFKTDSSRHRLSYEFEEFWRLIEDRPNCNIVIPYVTRVAQEIAIALERMNPNPTLQREGA